MATTGTAALSFEAADFCLYESHLGSDGSVYEIVARYPLG